MQPITTRILAAWAALCCGAPALLSAEPQAATTQAAATQAAATQPAAAKPATLRSSRRTVRPAKPAKASAGAPAAAPKPTAVMHTAPVIIPATSLRHLQFAPLQKIRVFRCGAHGQALAIPFQVDEKDKYSDFVVDQGRLPNTGASNGVYDNEDELTFMGLDVGPVAMPTSWPGNIRPSKVVEIKYQYGGDEVAVYAGVFDGAVPPLSPKSYVNFNLEKAEIATSKYSYQFNGRNYLVVRGAQINQAKSQFPLLDSSTFFLRADLKFLPTVSINHQSIKSVLEAYKVGPVRAVVRVNFDYTLGPVHLELGMYTEVSFFSNAVLLPAIIENPLNSRKILNKGSLFYYGFSMVTNPMQLALNANLPPFPGGKKPFDDIDANAYPKDGKFWISAAHANFMFFLEMITSPEMQGDQNIPAYYVENHSGAEIAGRSNAAVPLGESPVNVALVLDLANLAEGAHKISLRLFIDNKRDDAVLKGFTNIDQWRLNERIL
jgi:hypothetical protein